MSAGIRNPRQLHNMRLSNNNTASSIEQQKIKFPEMCDWMDREILPCINPTSNIRLVVINAPVKSGKRCMVEYSASLDSIPNSTLRTREHIFISAFHRRADQLQRNELSSYGIKVHSIINTNSVNKTLADIQSITNSGKMAIIHLDEADYGSGTTQKLSHIWMSINNNNFVKIILYSATIEEAIYSNRELMEGVTRNIVENFSTDTIKYAKYTPPSTFCGPKKFLDEGLVHNAVQFFGIDSNNIISLSEHAKTILGDMQENMQQIQNSENNSLPRRNIIILRLSYCVDIFGNDTARKDKKAIRVFLNNVDLIPELDECIIIVDKSGDVDFDCRSNNVLFEQVQWSHSAYWTGKTTQVPIIVIMDQTSSRSTEWACHNRVFAVHNFSNTIFFNNKSQQDERINHYSPKYQGFQPIKIYGHIRSFEYSAGLITVASYLHGEYQMQKLRINPSLFHIIDIETGNTFLTNCSCNEAANCRGGSTCPCGFEKEDAEKILLIHGSHCIPKLSPRINSVIKDKPDIHRRFIPCRDDAVYNAMIDDPMSEINTFINEGGEQWNLDYISRPNIFSHQTRVADDGTIHTNLRSNYNKLYYDQLSNWGFSSTAVTPRLMVCYHRETNQIGICARTYHGMILSTDISTTTSSMYL